LSYAEIILLGIIQGLTEFFPVSSSGHLVLFQNLFGLREPQLFVDVMLHLGTVLSLLVFLRKELLSLGRSLLLFIRRPKKGFRDPGMNLLFALALASLPTFFIGYFFSGFFESLFASLRTVGLALVVTGTYLFLTKYAGEKKSRLPFHPFILGILQGAAIVPGLSRSGLTIGGALFLGWKRDQAARFSFLLAIPAIFGAAIFQSTKVDWGTQPWPAVLTGVVVSAVFGYIALSLLLSVVLGGKFHSFSYYCFLAGSTAIVISFFM
jgi:undecaprenyl-diphosphatase